MNYLKGDEVMLKKLTFQILCSTCVILIIAVLMLCSGIVIAEGMRNYYCPKCGAYMESINSPCMTPCPSGGGHQWRCLGEVGDRRYQCSKCGVIIKSKENPIGNVPCKQGGGHNWKRIS